MDGCCHGLPQLMCHAALQKVDGACAMGYQEWAQNRSYCEKPCPANYTTAYVTPLCEWRRSYWQPPILPILSWRCLSGGAAAGR